MKKRNITKFMALVLGVTLASTALVGCGQKDSGSSKESSVVKESSTASTSAAASSEVEEENAIKWSGTITMAPYMFGPVEEDIITPLIEEKLLEYGYDVTLENVYLENSQYSELLNLKLASGDAPDLFYCGSTDNLAQYRDQGLIATYTEEFFRENAPDIAAFIDDGEPNGSNAPVAEKYWAMAKFGEDEICVLPSYSKNTGSLINVIYNKQWLENLNAEVPETLDEFVELMYRFKNEDPDGNGVDDTYGFSTTMLNVIFGAYGSFPGFLHMDYGHFYEVDGQLVSADVMEGNEEALKLITQLYADGIIDPEFLTGENQGGYWALSHSFMNGRIGVTHSARYGHYQPEMTDSEGNVVASMGACLKEFKAIQGEDADVVIGPWIEGPDGYVGGFLREVYQIAEGTCMNADLLDDPEKMAAILQIMNLFCTDDYLAITAVQGVEGVHFTYAEEGYRIANSEVLPDNASKNAIGLMALRCLYGPSCPFNYDYFTNGDTSPSNAWALETKAQYENLADTVGYISAVWGSLPSSADYSGEVQTYRDEYWLNVIQGKVELDWDAYVEEWYNRGGDILTEEANEWYAENN